MNAPRIISLFALFLCASLALAIPPQNSNITETLRGWLSDETCAKGRAGGGTYTATNPRCAKECVSKGKKIVLVDPVGKRVLVLSNQDIGKNNVGDYVEIFGQVDAKAMTLHADSLKFLEKGSAMCSVQRKKKAGL